MFKYYLYHDYNYIEVEELFFKDLINLYSTKFEICKFNKDSEPCCESEMFYDEALDYYLFDTKKRKLVFFARVYKISNEKGLCNDIY